MSLIYNLHVQELQPSVFHGDSSSPGCQQTCLGGVAAQLVHVQEIQAVLIQGRVEHFAFAAVNYFVAGIATSIICLAALGCFIVMKVKKY